MVKNGWVIVGNNSFNEIMKIYNFNPQKVLIVSKTTSGDKYFDSVEKAIEWINTNDNSPKNDIYILGGKSIYQYCYDKKLFDDFFKVRIDVEVCGDDFLGFNTHNWVKTKTSEIYYQAGYQFWYERYDARKFTSKPSDDKLVEDSIEALYMKEIGEEMGTRF